MILVLKQNRIYQRFGRVSASHHQGSFKVELKSALTIDSDDANIVSQLVPYIYSWFIDLNHFSFKTVS